MEFILAHQWSCTFLLLMYRYLVVNEEIQKNVQNYFNHKITVFSINILIFKKILFQNDSAYSLNKDVFLIKIK